MDQQSSEALAPSSSLSPTKLNAKAPEFVPRPPPPQPVLHNHHVFARPPPPFVPPPTPPPAYYGYDGGYYQQTAVPFYRLSSVGPVSPVEVEPDRSNGETAVAAAGGGGGGSAKSGLSDAHLKILNQVEFYFSDINLATTDQLFRYMIKDPEGYVPLSVVASFKKIRTALNGGTQLATILQSSKKLLVGEDGKKVKRQQPLTESEMEELQSRIVMAENLPEDHSHQNLMRIFSSVGSVKSIRTCPPQHSNNGASSASKTGKGDAMHSIGKAYKFHAFVEYESVELAEKAVMELTDEGNWRNGLKVRLLLRNALKPNQVRGKKVGNEGHPSSKKDETTIPEAECFQENHLEDSRAQSDSHFHENQTEDNRSNSNNAQRKGRNNVVSNGKGKGKGKGRGRPQHHMNGEVSMTIGKLIAVAKTPSVPRMPDGTKGFAMGRGKPLAVKTA